MKINNHIKKGNIKNNSPYRKEYQDNYIWSNEIRQEIIRFLWENVSGKREPVRLFSKPENEYGISYESAIYIYKVIPDMSVFGHYKAYKKEINRLELMKYLKKSVNLLNNKYNTIIEYSRKPRQKYKQNPINSKNQQYYLFDLEPYTKKKENKSNNIIETDAKDFLHDIAEKIWYWKQRVETDSKNKFIKSFSYAFFSNDNPNPNPYIEFDDNGKLKKGCKKYWNYLKKEVSKLSKVPVKELII